MSDNTPDQINLEAPPSGAGCADCEAAGGWWVHLRRCGACGHVGCCDTSPAQHATQHATETGHRFVQSFEPGEDWFFDYQTREFAEGPELMAPTSRPDDQSVPGPSGRVPANWAELIHR